MRKFLALLKRVPVWLWLFIAVVQVSTVVALSYELPEFDRTIKKMGNDNDPEALLIKAEFERFYAERRRDFVTGLILGPASIGLAYWKWSSTRPWARRFSLRTLIIVTTLVAVVLGLIVYLARR